MFIQRKMVTFLVIVFFGCSAIAEEKCECDIFQTSKNTNENNSYEVTNFTKQSGEINGRPFYFSIKKEDEKEIVWWNDTASSWMIQSYTKRTATTIAEVKIDNDCPNFPTIEDWKILSEGSNAIIKTRCLKDQNKCPVKGEFDSKELKMFF